MVNFHKNADASDDGDDDDEDEDYYIHSWEILLGLIGLQMLNFIERKKTFCGIANVGIQILRMKFRGLSEDKGIYRMDNYILYLIAYCNPVCLFPF